MNATGDAARALWYSLLAIFRVDLEGDLVAAESLTPFRSSVLFALKSLWDSSGEKSVRNYFFFGKMCPLLKVQYSLFDS